MNDDDRRMREALRGISERYGRTEPRTGNELLEAARVRARGLRISLAGGVVAVAALLAITVSSIASLFLGPQIHFPADPPKGAENGFAVWPEDTFHEAATACVTRAPEEDWRLDPKEAAFEFAREVLGYPNPKIPEDARGKGNTKVFIVSDAKEKHSLGTVLNLRRYGDCWYVTLVSEREGYPGASIAYLQGDRVAMRVQRAINFGGGRPDKATLELGFGRITRRTETVDGRQVIFEIDRFERGPGHFLITFDDRRGWGSQGGLPLEPQLEDDFLGVRAQEGGYAVWPETSAKASEAKCEKAQRGGPPRVLGKRGGSLGLEPWRKAPETLLTWYVEGVRTGDLIPGYFDGLGPYELVETSVPLVWRAVPRADSSLPVLEIELRRVRGGCYAVKDLRSPGRSAETRIWVDKDRASLALGDMGRANSFYFALTMGKNGTSGTLQKDDRLFPFTLKATLPEGKPGNYTLFLYRGKALYAAESRTIGATEFPERMEIP